MDWGHLLTFIAGAGFASIIWGAFAKGIVTKMKKDFEEVLRQIKTGDWK